VHRSVSRSLSTEKRDFCCGRGLCDDQVDLDSKCPVAWKMSKTHSPVINPDIPFRHEVDVEKTQVRLWTDQRLELQRHNPGARRDIHAGEQAVIADTGLAVEVAGEGGFR